MLHIAQYNTLTIDRSTSVGMYLTDGMGNDVLLPKKYIKPFFEVGKSIKVFVYKDYEHRWVATTLKPYVTLHHFAYLKVKNVDPNGAFLDWGLEKDLFVPYREQKDKMQVGYRYMVYVYEDEKTQRLVASNKINKFIGNEKLTVNAGDEVNIQFFETTPLGYNVIVNNIHKGLVYHNEIFQKVRLGDQCKAYIKAIRENNEIDISIRAKGIAGLEEGAEKILNFLQNNNRFLALNDHSSPQDIEAILQMSKKNFKRSIGILYKKKLIAIEEKGIRLL